MVSTRKKGRFYELKAKEYYEKQGWLIHLAPMSTKWQKQQDIFSIFDLIGIRKHEGKAEKLYVQVKFGQTRGMIKKMLDFKSKYLNEFDLVILMVFTSPTQFKNYYIYNKNI